MQSKKYINTTLLYDLVYELILIKGSCSDSKTVERLDELQRRIENDFIMGNDTLNAVKRIIYKRMNNAKSATENRKYYLIYQDLKNGKCSVEDILEHL